MNIYVSISNHEGGRSYFSNHGYCTSETQAILRAWIDRNGHRNSPSYYGGKLVSYRTVVFRCEPDVFGDEFTRNIRARAENGEGEALDIDQ